MPLNNLRGEERLYLDMVRELDGRISRAKELVDLDAQFRKRAYYRKD